MPSFFKKIVVATHNGNFHADDVFAVAVLSVVFKDKIKVLRTRDSKKIAVADYAVDVGGIYDADKKRFDHHQRDGAGRHENGVSCAAFGLVWKHYGEKLSGSKEVAKVIEDRLVVPLDAFDNGEGELKEVCPSVFPYTLNDLIEGVFNQTKDESERERDKNFASAVVFAKKVILAEIEMAKTRVECRRVVRSLYDNAVDKRVIIIEDNRGIPYEDFFSEYPEPLFIVYKYPGGDWAARAIRKTAKSFQSRLMFPESWSGLRDGALADVTGISDAVFCHNKRFLCIAKSKEGALVFTRKAVAKL